MKKSHENMKKPVDACLLAKMVSIDSLGAWLPQIFNL